MVQNTVSQLVVRSVRLVAAIGALAMASTGEVEFFILAVFLGLFLLGVKLETLPRLAKMAGVAQPVLALLVFALAVIDFFYLSKSFLLTVATFLLLIQGLRLLALGTLRENVGCVLLSSLMILSASTLAIEWTFFVMLFCFLPAVIWTVILINLSFEGEHQLIERSFAWRQLLPTLRSATAAAFGITIFCCAIVFIAFPRFSFRGFKGQFLQPVHKTGFTTTVNLAKTGRIYTDNGIVMRVKMSATGRQDWDGYLRGSTLDMFDGREWKRQLLKTRRIARSLFGDVRLASRVNSTGPRLHQTIYLEAVDSPFLFAAAWPAALKIDQPFIDMAEDFSLQRRQGDTWRIHYEVDSFPKLRTAETLTPEMRQALLLPGFVPEKNMIELTRTIVGNSRDPREKAKKIETYLRTNYRYSLFANAADSPSPLQRFLFESKEGHCEYFASAMCVMLRLSGVPTRIVSGFVAHEWNKQGNYYVVRMWDAHAWVEVFIKPVGWVSFDPTPRDFGGREKSGGISWFSSTMDYFNLQWNRYILSYDLERQVGFIKSLAMTRREFRFRADHWFDWFKWKGLPWKRNETVVQENPPINFLPIVVFIGVGGLFFLVWVLAKSRHEKTIWFYRPLLRVLEKVGGPKPTHQTIGEFYLDLSSKLGEKAPAVFRLTQYYYRFRFDPTAKFTEEEDKTVRDILKSLHV